MKKSLVALAALAAVSAASAQSSVTLYGIADIWFGSSKNGVPTAVRQTVLNSGGLSGSRFGLRGTEDLGGGLKGNFVFENGFNLDNAVLSSSNAGVLTSGAAAGSATAAAAAGTVDAIFGRQAFVGLSGGFGEIRLGRQYSAYDDLRGATDTLGHTSFSASAGNGAWDRNGHAYTFRVNNELRYSTPNIGGFTAALSLGLGENKTAAASADSVTALHALYANGPIQAGIGFQNEKNGTANTSLKHTLIAGSYNFGVAKLNAGYNTSKQATAEDKEFQVGVTVPFGATSVAVSYGSSQASLAGVDTTKGTAVGLQAIYALSKRTDAYFGLLSAKTANAAGVDTAKTAVTAVGVRHRF